MRIDDFAPIALDWDALKAHGKESGQCDNYKKYHKPVGPSVLRQYHRRRSMHGHKKLYAMSVRSFTHKRDPPGDGQELQDEEANGCPDRRGANNIEEYGNKNIPSRSQVLNISTEACVDLIDSQDT